LSEGREGAQDATLQATCLGAFSDVRRAAPRVSERACDIQ